MIATVLDRCRARRRGGGALGWHDHDAGARRRGPRGVPGTLGPAPPQSAALASPAGPLRASAYSGWRACAGATDAPIRLGRLPGWDRRFTDSHELGTGRPVRMPVTQWSTPITSPQSVGVDSVAHFEDSAAYAGWRRPARGRNWGKPTKAWPILMSVQD